MFVQEAAGKFARTAVSLGRPSGNLVEVTSGIEAGVRVVVEGVFTLRSQAQKDELKGHED
ncbi:MAG: hypothetical protein EOO75_04555 [Myxococcales bacterium]|nr:MAG: hypothetical protein EOO75_04555 [Myxococcales bacterium]